MRGPLLSLLGLLDGTFDGDALFFSRGIAISGKVDALLALRNAIEDADLKPSDFVGLGGSIGSIADSLVFNTVALARRLAARPRGLPMSIELVCPAGTPTALRSAVKRARTRSIAASATRPMRATSPASISSPELREGVRFAHERGAKVWSRSTPSRGPAVEPWAQALANAEEAKADAVILADIAALDYCVAKHPNLRIHLSVQAAAATPEAIGFYAEAFGVKRVVLPRVLSVEEIAMLNKAIGIETEVFVFGGLCPMAEGRCALSSYATGRSPNISGVCSPPEAVAYSEDRRGTAATLGGFTINRFQPGEPAGYPTLCKGRFVAGGKTSYLFEDPTSLNAAGLIGSLKKAGVTALKSKAGSAARAIRRGGQDVPERRGRGQGRPPPLEAERALQAFVEGGRQTSGAYKKSWR